MYTARLGGEHISVGGQGKKKGGLLFENNRRDGARAITQCFRDYPSPERKDKSKKTNPDDGQQRLSQPHSPLSKRKPFPNNVPSQSGPARGSYAKHSVGPRKNTGAKQKYPPKSASPSPDAGRERRLPSQASRTKKTPPNAAGAVWGDLRHGPPAQHILDICKEG